MGKFYVFCALITLSFIGCEKFKIGRHVNSIAILNNTDSTVVFVLGYEYPAITMPETHDWRIVAPGERANYSISYKESWKDKINSLPADTLLLFVINIDTFNKYGYDNVRATNNVKDIKKIAAGDLASDKGGVIPYP
jgi:hypothetical protein